MYGPNGQAYENRTAIPATRGPMQRARQQEKALDQPMRGRPAAKRALGIECRQHAKRHRKRSNDYVECSTACVMMCDDDEGDDDDEGEAADGDDDECADVIAMKCKAT